MKSSPIPSRRSYLPLNDFVSTSLSRAQVWRLLVGALVIFVVYVLWLALVMTLAAAESGLPPDGDIMNASRPGSALLMLSTFPGMTFGLLIAVRMMHGRSAATLIGRRDGFWRNFRGGATGPLILSTLLIVPLLVLNDSAADSMSVTRNLDFGHFFLYLPFALVLIFIQTGTEEAIFRGYFLQQLAARFRSPLAWMVVPSLLFGLLHYSPAMPWQSALLMMAWATLFGLFTADLTARTGSLAAAWGFHFVNNVNALLIVGSKEAGGLALWVMPSAFDDPAGVLPAMIIQAIVLLCSWLAARLALRV